MQYLNHVVCSSIALFFAIVPSSALAGPGDLDLLFGINGKVITSTGFSDEANAVALQTDGKIVVAGYTNAFGGGIVARYNTDGSLDVSFGSGGIALPGGHAHGTHFKAVQIQPDGKIIAAGHFGEPGGCPGWRGRIVRLNTDGSLDVPSTLTAERPALGNTSLAATLRILIRSRFSLTARSLLPEERIIAGRIWILSLSDSTQTANSTRRSTSTVSLRIRSGTTMSRRSQLRSIRATGRSFSPDTRSAAGTKTWHLSCSPLAACTTSASVPTEN
jgi:uncharacterized delta-60 repeat protein